MRTPCVASTSLMQTGMPVSGADVAGGDALVGGFGGLQGHARRSR